MNADLITAAVLFGPAALAGAVGGAGYLHQRPHDRARAQVLAELRAARTAGPDEDPTPPDGGQPTPAEQPTAAPVRLAPVIPLPARPVRRPAVPRPARRAA